ncbi:hypothetical protein NPIL_237891 [Nephila pilipes]|uniref:Uncharacterized protein n=1 Tax=Nephila pilipes TaxID=299642 RepID=A0A8X6PP52_NEPPI|nr:hypothetical protein NPIL_237891 [Nephila pilipes]
MAVRSLHKELNVPSISQLPFITPILITANKPPFATRIHGISLLRRIELATRFIFFSPHRSKPAVDLIPRAISFPFNYWEEFSNTSPTYSHLRRAIPCRPLLPFQSCQLIRSDCLVALISNTLYTPSSECYLFILGFCPFTA